MADSGQNAGDRVERGADAARQGLQRRDDDDGDDRQHDGVLRHRLPALIREAREEILDLVHEIAPPFFWLELSTAGRLLPFAAVGDSGGKDPFYGLVYS